MIDAGEKSAKVIIGEMTKLIEAEPLAKIDYIKMVDALTMQQIPTIDRPMLLDMAVYIGKTRLIDNLHVN